MPADDDPGEVTEEAASPRGRVRRLLRAVTKSLGPFGTTLVAVATGAVALIYTVAPELKPDPRDTLAAEVEVVAVERVVSRDEWRNRVAAGDRDRYFALLRADNRATDFPVDDKCGIGTLLGHIVSVATEAKGYKRRELSLKAAIVDARTQRLIPGEYDELLAQFPIDAPTAKSVQRIFLQDVSTRAKRIVVRVEISDPEGNLLGVADSKPFAPISHREAISVAEDLECRPPDGDGTKSSQR